jgi:HSP20 family protein
MIFKINKKIKGIKMTLVRINPLAELERIAKHVQEATKNFVQEERIQAPYSVRADISENEHSLYIQLELPGVQKENISIAVDNDRNLIVKGEKKREEEASKRSIIRCETCFGKFHRAFILANDLDETSINAKFENGLLSLSIPKKKKEEIEKEITIN